MVCLTSTHVHINKHTGYINQIRGDIMEFPQSEIKHGDLTINNGDMVGYNAISKGMMSSQLIICI